MRLEFAIRCHISSSAEISLAPTAARWVASVVRYRRVFGHALFASCPVTKDVALRRDFERSRPIILGECPFDSRLSPRASWGAGQDRRTQARGQDVACSGFRPANIRRSRLKTRRTRLIRVWRRRAAVLLLLCALFSADCWSICDMMTSKLRVGFTVSLAPTAARWVASVVRYRRTFGHALFASCPVTKDVALRRDFERSRPIILGGSSMTVGCGA